MQPEHKFATATKLCHEVLQAVADGVIELGEGQSVLGDALAVLACKDIKVSAISERDTLSCSTELIVGAWAA